MYIYIYLCTFGIPRVGGVKGNANAVLIGRLRVPRVGGGKGLKILQKLLDGEYSPCRRGKVSMASEVHPLYACSP